MAAPSLPPLAAIRVFEAAARHASFTKAAARARHDPGGGELPDQGARGTCRRAAVPAEAAPGRADRSRAAPGARRHAKPLR